MTSFWPRLNTLLLFLVLLSIIGFFATRAFGGPLDPPGAPAPSGITITEAGSWSQTLSDVGGCTSPRFACVLNNEAILDRETGLVWERTIRPDAMSWGVAQTACAQTLHGARLGWRLPSDAELRTVADGTDSDGSPAGMPTAGGVASRTYWTSTTVPLNPVNALIVWFGDADGVYVDNKTTGTYGIWCVRGPSPWLG